MDHIGQLSLEFHAFEYTNLFNAFIKEECKKHISKTSWPFLFKFIMWHHSAGMQILFFKDHPLF